MKLFCSEHDYKNKSEVRKEYPDAIVIKKVCGGWYIFSSQIEYQTWKNQK